MECRACHRDLEKASFPEDEGAAVCFPCCMALGVIPMPPPRRPAQPCLRCNGMKFVRVMPRELSARSDEMWNRMEPVAAPMALTYAFTCIPGEVARSPTLYDQRGLVETYVCKKCGFVEWYCQRPEHIPIGPEYMTDEIDYEGQAPYR